MRKCWDIYYVMLCYSKTEYRWSNRVEIHIAVSVKGWGGVGAGGDG